MSVYSTAIRKLMRECDKAGLNNWEVAYLLAALRGPDSDNYEEKAVHTAPIRLRLLGNRAYSEAEYAPNAADVPPLFSEATTPSRHYNNHINTAISVIKKLDAATSNP